MKKKGKQDRRGTSQGSHFEKLKQRGDGLPVVSKELKSTRAKVDESRESRFTTSTLLTIDSGKGKKKHGGKKAEKRIWTFFLCPGSWGHKSLSDLSTKRKKKKISDVVWK